eukprot:scaffold2219_cov177-Amphora_coffeaeformis.AAC.19
MKLMYVRILRDLYAREPRRRLNPRLSPATPPGPLPQKGLNSGSQILVLSISSCGVFIANSVWRTGSPSGPNPPDPSGDPQGSG